MTSTPTQFPLVYLLEILASPGGDTAECDNFANLDVAIERALSALLPAAVPLEVEVSIDDDGQLEGVGFFNEDRLPLAFITVYHLERDTEQAKEPRLHAACRGELAQLESALNSLVRA